MGRRAARTSADLGREEIARFELGLEAPDLLTRLESAVDVRQILERRLGGELAHVGDVRRARAEAQAAERAAKVVALHVADFWIEVVADVEIVGAGAVAIGVVLEPSLIAVGITRSARRARPRVIAAKRQRLIEAERGVHAVGLVRAVGNVRRRPVGEHCADAAAAQDVALDADHREVGVRRIRHLLVVCLQVHVPMPYLPALPLRRPPTSIGMTRLRLSPMRRE